MKLIIVSGETDTGVISMLTGKATSIENVDEPIFEIWKGTNKDIETLKKAGILCEKISD